VLEPDIMAGIAGVAVGSTGIAGACGRPHVTAVGWLVGFVLLLLLCVRASWRQVVTAIDERPHTDLADIRGYQCNDLENGMECVCVCARCGRFYGLVGHMA
jgi:hypothetical protein